MSHFTYTPKKAVKGFQVIENECIWMRTGIVNFRLCDNAFDCISCPFDKAMQRAMGGHSSAAQITEGGWSESLRKHYRATKQLCRHVMTGRIAYPKICAMNYECHHCEYDQWLDDVDLDHAMSAPHYSSAAGYRLADGHYYHFGHTWARFEHGGHVRIGFDDFLVKLFGPAQHIDLPPLGSKVKQHEIGWTFARSTRKAAVLSPITGSVLAVNQRVKNHPEISHQDPYHEGWLAVVSPAMPKRNLKGLYYGNESKRWIESESQKLLNMIDDGYEALAATGGEAINDLVSTFPDIDWSALTEAFLGTQSSK